MSSNEKTELFSRVLSSVEKIEAASDFKSFTTKKIPTPFYNVVNNIWNVYITERKLVPTLAFIMVLLVTGGTSIAAEKALPGESLYPLKININEQIQALTAFTPEAKARVAAGATNERIKEAVILSKRGQLSPDTKKIIEKQILKNAVEVKNQVASLVSTNNLKAAQSVTINFESALKAHALILEKISNATSDASSTSSETGSSTISSILGTVKNELATTTSARVNLDEQEFKTSSNDPKQIEQKLSDIKSDFSDLNDILNKKIAEGTVGTSTASSSKVKISNISKYIDEATKNLKLTIYPDALTAIQKAEQLISDVEAVINANSSLEGDSDATDTTDDSSLNDNASSTNATSTVSANASSTASSTTSV